MLINTLAKHALVLTIQTKALRKPLDLPNLQHLALDIDSSSTSYLSRHKQHEAFFSAFYKLKGLKTLYIQSSSWSGAKISGNANLTGCVQLKYMAVQGVSLTGKVVLPSECHLHGISMPHGKLCEVTSAAAHLFRGLTIRQRATWSHQMLAGLHNELAQVYTKCVAPNMKNLTRLQLILDEGAHSYEQCERNEGLQLHIDSSKVPALEVLEVQLQPKLAMTIRIDLALPLRTLVISAAGALYFHELPMNEMCLPQITTLKDMYLQSGAALSPDYKKHLQDLQARRLPAQMGLLEYVKKKLMKSLHARRSPAETWLLKYVKEEAGGWIAQMPAGFQPGNLQECCCSACPGCLARAGVPIICNQAWTSMGFNKHLRRHCNGAA